MPRVSVIIPAHNMQPYLEECLNSALSQTFKDFEIIVVNDGSTDGSAKLLDRFSDRVLILEQTNKGVAAARNAGLARAGGQYVALLDADDSWVPERLEIMVTYLNARPELTLITSDAYLLESTSGPQSTYYMNRPKRLRFRYRDQPYWIHQYNFILGFVLCRREAFDVYGHFDESLRTFEDWDLWLRFIAWGASASFIGRPLGFYRLRSDSLTAAPVEMLGDEISLLERALSRPESANIPGLRGRIAFAKAKKALADADWVAARQHFKFASADRNLPAAFRRRAATASLSPSIAWKYYGHRLGRRPG